VLLAIKRSWIVTGKLASSVQIIERGFAVSQALINRSSVSNRQSIIRIERNCGVQILQRFMVLTLLKKQHSSLMVRL